MKRHRIGVIGYGVWGTHSLQESLARVDGVEIAAVHAHDRWGYGAHEDPIEAGRQYARERGCEFCDDWESIIADPDIDVLSVMTSPAAKLEPVLGGLARDKSIVMDKPLALTAAAAQQMVEAEERSRGVGFVLCGQDNSRICQRLKGVMEEGRLGQIKHVDVRLYFVGGVYPGFSPTARYRREVPGGELTVIGTHAIQTLLGVTGSRALSVSCRLGQKFYPEYAAVGYEDWAELLLVLEGGVTAGISVGRLPHRPDDQLPLIEMSGTRGYATVTGEELVVWPGPGGLGTPETIVARESTQERYDRIFGEFLLASETGSPSPISFTELYEVQRVLEAAYQSAAARRPVRLSER